jgi:hypothetical protein
MRQDLRLLLAVITIAVAQYGCSPAPIPEVTLETSAENVRVGEAFSTRVTVVAPERGLCLHQAPRESFLLGFWPLLDNLQSLVLPARESAVECIAPFGQLAFEFSLSLTETNEQLVMWMDGAEIANIPLVEELSIRTTLYPAFGQGFLGSWDSTFSEGIASEPVLITILPAQ